MALTTITVQFSDNGEPIIQPEWLAIDAIGELCQKQDRAYLKLIVLLNAYRSPYRNPAKRLSYKERVKSLLEDWDRRWGGRVKPSLDVMMSDTYRQAEQAFIKSQYDPLWDKLIVLERKESDLIDSIREMSFSSDDDFDLNPDDVDDGRRRRKKTKPDEQLTAEAITAQSKALDALLETQKKISAECETLRIQLWRETKPRQSSRAVDMMGKIENN